MSGLELDVDPRDAADREATDRETAEVDREEVVDRIESRATDIRERQVERTLSQCTAHGEFTPEQERAVEVMAENLVDALLDAPRETVADADDPEKLRTALDLFDPET